MFFNITGQQIVAMRNKVYPQNINVHAVTIKSYGTDNSVEIDFSIIDQEPYKIFNNLSAKKYIRLKVFEISNAQMYNELQQYTQLLNSTEPVINKIQNLINKYGYNSIDLCPSLDFIGDKNNSADHTTVQSNSTSLQLNFKVKFILPRPKIDYLSLGMIFYSDAQEYINDKNLQDQFIDNRVLYNNLVIKPLFSNDKVLDTAISLVNDLRMLNTISANKKAIEDLTLIINSKTSIDKYNNGKRSIANKSYANSFDTLYNNVIRNKLAANSTKYFSDVFYSRHWDRRLGMFFYIDYLQAVKDHMPYRDLVNNKTFLDFIQKSNISNINVLRREVTKNYTPTNTTIKQIINTRQQINNNLLEEKNDNNGAIKEINVFKNLRCFSVVDKEFLSAKKSIYQYGVEITVSNGLTQYLKNFLFTLYSDIKNLKLYLQETNKLVNKLSDSNSINTTGGGSYTKYGRFTIDFINDDFNSKLHVFDGYGDYVNNQYIYTRSAKRYRATYKTMTISSVNNFVNALEMLNFLDPETNAFPELRDNLYTHLNASTASAESISHFIKIYQKIINYLENMIKDNSNKSFKLSTWFTNDYVDTSIPPEIGYQFLAENEVDENNDFGTINSTNYDKRINNELQKSVVANSQGIITSYSQKKYSYLTPVSIFSKDFGINFISAADKLQTISDYDYRAIDLDIKNFLLNNKKQDTVEATDSTTDEQDLRLNSKASIDSYNILLNLNIKVNNTFNTRGKENNSIEAKQLLNTQANCSLLGIMLSNNYDSRNKKFNTAVNNNKNKLFNARVNTNFPIQLYSFIDRKHPLLDKKDPLKESIVYSSKINFLLNTIHAVEYLEINPTSKAKKWYLLTKNTISSLPDNKLLLCRMVQYRNPTIGIQGLNEIDLPVYNQYFLFKK